MVTIVSAPLYRTALDERQKFVPQKADDEGATTADGARRLLLVVPKADADQKANGGDWGRRETRTELVVTLEKHPTPSHVDPQVARHSEAIGSAHIKYRILRAGETSLAPLSKAKVDEILSAADLDKHPENFADAARKLFSVKVRNEAWAEKPWVAGEFFMLGLKTHDEIARMIRTYDGDWDLEYEVANRQISAYRANESRVHRTTLADFNGDRQESKYAPKKYPGHIVFPTLVVNARYSNDRLVILEMTFVDSAEFNEPVQRNQLTLAAPANTKVFQFDKDPVKQPKFMALPGDTDDVAKLLHDRGFLPPEPEENPK